MRVLMLSWEYPPRVIGGVAPHVRDLSRALVSQGHQVTVLVADHPDAPPVADDQGVEVRRVFVPYPQAPDFATEIMQFNLAMLQHALSLLQEGREIDLIHCHDWLVAAAGRSLKQLSGRPMLATIHATEFGRNGGLHNPLQHYISAMEWWLAYEAHRVITCSRYMRDEVRRVFQVPASKVHVIPNGVRAAELHLSPSERQRLQEMKAHWCAPDGPVLFFIGRLVWEKGVQDLIDALPLIRMRFPKARLIVAGDGPLKSQLAQRAAQLGLGEAVYFPGFVGGQRRNLLLALADVAVVPSRYEPFGIVALEAMAAGVPVVVADTGGLAEVVDHGRNGLKVPPANPAALAQGILSVLEDVRLARRLTSEAARDIERRFDWAAIARQTASVYTAVLEEHRDGRWGRARDAARRSTLSPASLRVLAGRAVRSRYYPTGATAVSDGPARREEGSQADEIPPALERELVT